MNDYEKIADNVIQKKRRKEAKVLMVLNVIVTILGFYNLTRGDWFLDILGDSMVVSGLVGLGCTLKFLEEENND